jgi:hypothetical protein
LEAAPDDALRADSIEMTINLKTAKALGLTIPPVVIMRAEKVIKGTASGSGMILGIREESAGWRH